MKKYEVLITESLQINKHKYNLEANMCYNNVFNFATNNINHFLNNSYCICYGFVSSISNVWIRHAFILDQEKDMIIDPTLQFFGTTDDCKYIIFKKFDNYGEYIDLLCNESYPALNKSLMGDQLNLQKSINNNEMYSKYPMDILLV